MARKALKKEAMENAAIALFAKQGLSRTTIKEIAYDAGVAEGALYRHWRSKDKMAWSLFQREVKTFSSGLVPLLNSEDGNVATRLSDAIFYMYQYYQHHSVLFTFILLTQHGFPENFIEQDSPIDMVIAFVQKHMDEGSIIDGDAFVMGSLLVGAVLQPVYMHRDGRLGEPPVAHADVVSLACLRLLGVQVNEDAKEGV